VDQVVVLCIDGSEDSIAAARTGLARLARGGRILLATVVDAGDPTLLVGASGMAGGTMTPEQFDQMTAVNRQEGEAILAEAAATLDLPDAEHHVLAGGAGSELSFLAGEVGASVLVVGSRGRGAVKRALLGSVSDHLVRNAPCPVLVVRDEVED
jgi:nucleotide-binding universal stress UspA family protein